MTESRGNLMKIKPINSRGRMSKTKLPAISLRLPPQVTNRRLLLPQHLLDAFAPRLLRFPYVIEPPIKEADRPVMRPQPTFDRCPHGRGLGVEQGMCRLPIGDHCRERGKFEFVTQAEQVSDICISDLRFRAAACVNKDWEGIGRNTGLDIVRTCLEDRVSANNSQLCTRVRLGTWND
jgi:hypothetical protein